MRCLIIIALVALAGCTYGTFGRSGVAQAPPGVSYAVTSNNIDELNKRANTYCGHYDKKATLKGINKSSGRSIAEYNCE